MEGFIIFIAICFIVAFLGSAFAFGSKIDSYRDIRKIRDHMDEMKEESGEKG